MFHHTQTTVLDVLALDSGNVAVLTLINWSAEFDVVDDITLLQRLNTSDGTGGSVMDWLTSYLKAQIQKAPCSMSVLFPMPR